jgi:hypothetical protein
VVAKFVAQETRASNGETETSTPLMARGSAGDGFAGGGAFSGGSSGSGPGGGDPPPEDLAARFAARSRAARKMSALRETCGNVATGLRPPLAERDGIVAGPTDAVVTRCAPRRIGHWPIPSPIEITLKPAAV